MEKNNYSWKYSNVGGVPRVSIESGEDIAHLGELDQKMWTVLSCPTKGLEIDEKTLELIDTDKDGKIRVNEVIEASQWMTSVLKTHDLLLNQSDTLALADLNQDSEEGKKLFNSAKQILKNLGLEKDSISIADTADSVAIFATTKFNGDGVITENSTDDESLKLAISSCVKTIGSAMDRSGIEGVTAEHIEAFYANCADYAAWQDSAAEKKAEIFPYGDNTEAALNAYNAVKEKVADFFMRCKLVAFDDASVAALDVSVARMEAISEKNLSACNDEIASYPLARVNGKAELPLSGGINPAWAAAFANLKALILDVDFPEKQSITEAEWNAIAAKFSAFEAWKAEKKGDVVEALGLDAVKEILAKKEKEALLALVEQDKALEAEANGIQEVDKLLHLYRDLYTLIRNYVTFSDFYSHNGEKAIFQAGTLFIDQRSCDLCMRVSDMAKHNTMAVFSGMYLIYCDCTSKQKAEKMTIVAVMTDGDVNDLMVGKNAIFYDRNGVDWDAVVVKIVDNPISIRQAFWSPYQKFARFIEEKLNTFASSQDEKITSEAAAKINDASLSDKPADGAAAQPFDIAKYCGIFAAIGMALGYIGAFFVSLGTGIGSLFTEFGIWALFGIILGIILVISGPSMIMAWLKLRKRNLAPLLDANGWAINARAFVNIAFGATLTKIAQFPAISLQDPFAKKGMPLWKKILIVIAVLAVVAAVLYYMDLLPFCSSSPAETCPVADTAAAVADSLQNAIDSTSVAE